MVQIVHTRGYTWKVTVTGIQYKEFVYLYVFMNWLPYNTQPDMLLLCGIFFHCTCYYFISLNK